MTPAHITGALFVAWAALSLLWTQAWYDSIGALLELAILSGTFVLGSRLSDLRWIYLGAAFGIGISSLLVLMQFAGIGIGVAVGTQLPGNGEYPGLFVNPLLL